MKWLYWFLAGALAVPLAHHLVLYALYAAGLAVLVYDLINTHGLAALGPIVVAGGLLQMIAAALREGKSVVVDNTNPTPAVRAPLIALGRAAGARVVGYLFETVVKEAVARNRAREGRARVPDVAIYVTSKKLVPPSLEEGFDEVHVIAPFANAGS
jgi:hypothetical protein